METPPISQVRAYLVVFAEDSARAIPLRAGDELWLSSEALRLAAGARPSAPCARLASTATGWTIVPEVGAVVVLNGRPTSRPTLLASGDVVQFDDAWVAFHVDPRDGPPCDVLGAGELRRRLAQEVERAGRYGRSVSVLVVPLGEAEGDARSCCAGVLDAVRAADIVSFEAGVELVVVFPEVGEHATAPAQRVLAAVSPSARGSLAVYPVDGGDADALLGGARIAAQAARSGTIARVTDVAATLWLEGGRDTEAVELVAVDPAMRRLFASIRDLARSDLPVLVTGETGVGKELVARALHAWSRLSDGELVPFNCAAVPESLLESELFGHERGAFSGAHATRPGLFESADGGTLFLDEVGECSPRTQAELLRVLETGRIRRVGSTRERSVGVRLVAATNRDLVAEIEAGRFRRDLYYRLNAAHLAVPPLRDRPLDLPALARRFLSAACDDLGRQIPEISVEAMTRLQRHVWPGNARELRNAMRFVAAVARGPVITSEHLPHSVGRASAPWQARRRADERRPPLFTDSPTGFRKLAEEISELERARMHEALCATGGVRVHAAALIGMPLRTFSHKLRLYDLGGQAH